MTYYTADDYFLFRVMKYYRSLHYSPKDYEKISSDDERFIEDVCNSLIVLLHLSGL